MSASSTKEGLDTLDHIAISVENIAEAVAWYTTQFTCNIKYQDDTWALVEFANTRVAFVIPDQHPPHIAFVSPRAEAFGPLKTHRDGTRSLYMTDPSGNSIEIMAPYQ